MSILDGKPHVATEKEATARWNGRPKGAGFRCYLCGVKFKAGDTVRFVMGKGRTRNFFTCTQCDGPDVADRFLRANEEAARRFWWLFEDLASAHDDVHHEARASYDAGYDAGLKEAEVQR